MKILLDALDANFWALETPTTKQVVFSLCALDKEPNMDVLERNLKGVVARFPKLQYLLKEEEKLYWAKDSKFSIDYHLQVNTTTKISTPEELQKLALAEVIKGLDANRPLWRFVVLKGQSQDSVCSGILLVLHHALGDGMGGLELINALTSSTRESSLVLREHQTFPQYIQKRHSVPKEASSIRSFFASYKKLAAELTRVLLLEKIQQNESS